MSKAFIKKSLFETILFIIIIIFSLFMVTSCGNDNSSGNNYNGNYIGETEL